VGLSQFDESSPFTARGVFNPGDFNTALPLEDNSNRPRRFDAVLAVNTDSIDHTVQLIWVTGANLVLTTVNVPAGAGFGGALPVNLFDSLPAALQGGFPLANDVQLGVQFLVPDLNAGKQLQFSSFGGYLG